MVLRARGMLSRATGRVGDNVTSRRTWLQYVRDAVPAVAMLLGTAAYLKMLSVHYSWWIVLLVSPLALVGSAFVLGLCWISTEEWWARLIVAVLGGGWLYVGLTEPGRAGSAMTGLAFVLIALFPAGSRAPS